MKILQELIFSSWDIVENSTVNWLISGFLFPMIYVASFRITGMSAPFVGYNSKIMSIIYFIVNTTIFFVTRQIIRKIVYIVSIPVSFFNKQEPRLIAAIIVLLLVIVVAIFVKSKSKLNNKIFWK